MDASLLQQRVGMVGIVGIQWFAVAAVPFAVVRQLPPIDGWAMTLAAAIVAYCFYTGYRAWNRGWKTRFVLRLVIPVCLFVLSCVAVGLGFWTEWFKSP
jgi:hypothetical protein